jgi:hypothetical protein
MHYSSHFSVWHSPPSEGCPQDGLVFCTNPKAIPLYSRGRNKEEGIRYWFLGLVSKKEK